MNYGELFRKEIGKYAQDYLDDGLPPYMTGADIADELIGLVTLMVMPDPDATDAFLDILDREVPGTEEPEPEPTTMLIVDPEQVVLGAWIRTLVANEGLTVPEAVKRVNDVLKRGTAGSYSF